MNVKCNRFKFAFINGTTTANIKGEVNIADFYNNSMGYIEAPELIVNQETIVNHKGTGEMNVYGGSLLRGWIYNSGNVYYSGSPNAINVTEYSTGQLLKIE